MAKTKKPGGRRRGKKQLVVVDLHTMLMQCAQAVAGTASAAFSNVLANKTIRKLADSAAALHIIDFGILYGFIQSLSERPGGPPKLRITGFDFPQPGFRPAERPVSATYCQRFGVPFEYKAIAKK